MRRHGEARAKNNGFCFATNGDLEYSKAALKMKIYCVRIRSYSSQEIFLGCKTS